ncbi:hypothetical protein HPB52_012599 [Rhipicephalus sanguineus]|uniref:Uncharacterized protein n=1 Tax=Rhipicephalus sanguineus TaxID=34632 RepID=A0A9D4T9X7_RHISA|nr:hypothetical protein HPB52_012599 [Rhipicephalus sanguineus]
MPNAYATAASVARSVTVAQCIPLPAAAREPEDAPTTVREPEDAPARAAVATSARKASTSEPVSQASVSQPADECMETTEGSASAAAGKRPHVQTTSSEPQLDDGSGDEPPTKAPGVRRFPF